VKAGVDYMEFGYKASRDIFDENEFGPWKFCDEDAIRRIVGDNDTDMKIAVMADVGRCDYKRDIVNRADSAIDLIRVATYINTIPAALEIVEHCHNLGYETTLNIMAISNAKESDVDEALDLIGKSPVDGIYIVDSYGALYMEQIEELADKYLNMAERENKFVGIHAHNNQQLAFANTIAALTQGVSYLDATVNGMGRGAGNCSSEQLMGFLKNPKYNIIPLLKFMEKHMEPLKEAGTVWGYNIPYLLTGQTNQHPRTAIAATKENRKDYLNFLLELNDKD
jgi:4-hydroxy 2-oxovalerate aldolase